MVTLLSVSIVLFTPSERSWPCGWFTVRGKDDRFLELICLSASPPTLPPTAAGRLTTPTQVQVRPPVGMSPAPLPQIASQGTGQTQVVAGFLSMTASGDLISSGSQTPLWTGWSFSGNSDWPAVLEVHQVGYCQGIWRVPHFPSAETRSTSPNRCCRAGGIAPGGVSPH